MATALEAMVGVILLLIAFAAGAVASSLRGRQAVERWLRRHGCPDCQDKCENLRLWRDEDD